MKRGLLILVAMLAAMVLGSGVALAATIVGTNNADTRSGTVNRDTMYGLGGNDTLKGLGGNDEIHGDAGNDENLNGGFWQEEVSAGSGNDTIYASYDNAVDTIDCGKYASPNSISDDYDTVYADAFDYTT